MPRAQRVAKTNAKTEACYLPGQPHRGTVVVRKSGLGTNTKRIARFAFCSFPGVTAVTGFRRAIATSPTHRYRPLNGLFPTFMVDENGAEDISVCFAERTAAYKAVNRHRSFNSLDSNTELKSKPYPDSKITAKQTLQQPSKICWHRFLCAQSNEALKKFLFAEFSRTLAILMRRKIVSFVQSNALSKRNLCD